METAGLTPFAAWESFYVIIGSSAAALTGLQFVVIVLGSETRSIVPGSVTSAYATPTVMHFCAVLLISAIVSAPWPRIAGPAIALAICGFAGVIYVALVIRHSRRQTEYRPVLEDWLWHFVFPLIAYAMLFVAATMLPWHSARSMFAIGAVSLVLLFTGIHNAWDSVVYLASSRRDTPDPPKETR